LSSVAKPGNLGRVTPSFWILMAPLGAALAVTLRALARDRDPRHAVSLVFLALLALRHVASPPAALPALDAALETEAAPLLIAFAINLGAWLAASLSSSSIRERNRAEQLQWSSMEALRTLAERIHTPTRGQGDGNAALDQAQELLAYGCEHLQFETGLLVQRSELGIDILVAQTPEDVGGLETGDCPALATSLAARCFDTRDVVAIDRASEGPAETQPSQAPFAWESLAGLRIVAAGDSALAIVFADRKPRAARLGSVEKSLLTVMGRWLQARAETEAVRALPIAPLPAEPSPDLPTSRADTEADKPLTPTFVNDALASEPAPHVEPVASAETSEAMAPVTANEPNSANKPNKPSERTANLDLNRGVRDLETKLRKGLAPSQRLVLSLSPQAPTVEFEARSLERVAMSLLLHAADIVSNTAELEIATGVIEAPEPDAPGFGTLTVKARGRDLDTDQLGALYEGRGEGDAASPAQRRLPLPRVVRLLRDAGGDLSLESETGVGTTLTAFIPSQKRAPAAPNTETG
jgi:hypothetical protein